VGSLTLHPEIRTFGLVDIAEDVFQFAPTFGRSTTISPVPKVHQVVADGRHFLLSTGQSFDILTVRAAAPH